MIVSDHPAAAAADRTQAAHLAELRSRTRASSREAESIASGLSESQMAWAPSPAAWGIAQCLDHLATTFTAYDRSLADAFASGARRGSPAAGARYRPTWMGGFMMRSLGSVVSSRFRTPRVFDPGPAARSGALGRFIESQRALEAAIERAGHVDIAAIRLRSPASWLVRYSLGDALAILVGHVERHLAQARRVRALPGFPS
jgi:hypothetical protein